MTWRERMGPASFRGVPFHVSTSDRAGGRRTADHQYPFSEAAPYSEDLGRKGRTFSVEGYVLGTDYMAARDQLLDALEVSGPGELVHPYHGTLRVAVGSYRVRESATDGGIATFSIEFRETSSAPTQPATTVDAKAQVAVSAAGAKSSAKAEFLAQFSASAQLKSSANAALTAAAGAVGDVTAVLALPGQTVAELTAQVQEITDNAAALVAEPESLADAVIALLEALSDGVTGLVDGMARPFAALLNLVDFAPGTRPPETTPNREAERQNFDALQRLVQRVALVQSVLVAVEQPFVSYEEAVAVRAEIADAIDAHAEGATDDTYPALELLRGDLVRAVPGDAGDLPRLVKHTPPATVPALVLAHTLYGHLEREEDLIRRNRIAHPGFVAGGVELEALSE